MVVTAAHNHELASTSNMTHSLRTHATLEGTTTRAIIVLSGEPALD